MAKVFLHDQTRESAENNGNNARLTVICPSGSIVNAKCGQTEYTVISDNSNKAVFNGLHHGMWEVSLDDPYNIVSKIVEIVTDYEIVIDFFTATIVIEYPEGSVCTCTNGVSEYTAPDISGLWYCVVSDSGTWTVSCTDGSNTKSKIIEVTQNDSYINTLLSYFTATINVTYPSRAICSCSKDGTLYSASNTSGTWTFTVYKAGDWTITASDGIQTVSAIVNVSYDGQIESTTIKFFAATIDITYPEGATCICTDGTTSFTAPDTSGRWLATVPRIGTWTIRAFKGNGDVTQTATITYDGESVSVLCEFFVAYINVTYPKETFKVVLWRISDYGVKEDISVDTSGTGNHRFAVEQTGSYEIGAYRVSPYVGIESDSKNYATATATISEDKQTVDVTLAYVTVPEFTYTGNYKIVDDSGKTLTSTDGDWNIQFLTSGILRFTKLNGAYGGIEVFAVGGGGNGGTHYLTTINNYHYCAGGGGGGGGYRSTGFDVKVTTSTPYEISIGGSNGSTSAFGVSANGGSDGTSATSVDAFANGGTGGSAGGKGGYNAENATAGEDGAYPFMGTSGYRYGAGGGGGHGYNGEVDMTGSSGKGGKDGGGNGGSNGVANSGGGGGGENRYQDYGSGAGSGGSGIVIIRNKRY